MRGMTGNFEVHLTGRADDHHRMAEVAAPEGMKLTDIVLDRGRTPAQPMLTFTLKGSWDEVRAQVQDRRHRLAQHGVYAVREKIEADPNNPAVPRTDADAAADPDHRYFEHHLKLRLPDAAPDRLAAITALVTPHQARLSRNAGAATPTASTGSSPSAATGWAGSPPGPGWPRCATRWPATRSSRSRRSTSSTTPRCTSTTAGSMHRHRRPAPHRRPAGPGRHPRHHLPIEPGTPGVRQHAVFEPRMAVHIQEAIKTG
ncbi:hypothetical protein [Catenuloplanes niger]